MNQQAWMRNFDAHAIGTTFFGAGIADSATYTPPDDPDADPDADPPAPAPEPVSCTVLVDRDVQDFGADAAAVATLTTLVTLQRSQVEPAAGGTVALAGGETFVLVHQVRRDESISAWAVEVVSA